MFFENKTGLSDNLTVSKKKYDALESKYEQLNKKFTLINSYWNKDQLEISKILTELESEKESNIEFKQKLDDLKNELNLCYNKIEHFETNNISEPVFEEDNWYKYNSLDHAEMHQYIDKLDDKTIELNKVRNTLRNTRKYTRNLRKKIRKLDKHIQNYKKDTVCVSWDQLLKNHYTINDEFIFRNKCMVVVYGNMPSYSLWTPESTVYNIDYWNYYTEEDSELIINWLIKNYIDYRDFKPIITYFKFLRNSYINCITYNDLLKFIVRWLFTEN
tara:strand:+ start:886 stop:1704 length:819 start_codon:yes stop_codon:yes gene_type:complete